MSKLNFRLTTGLYFGAREIYLAQVKGSLFGPRLVKFGRTEIQLSAKPDQAAQKQALVQAIKTVLQQSNVSSKKVAIALPGKDTLIRYFQMPKIPKREWETAIKFEAKKYIPFKAEELMWDYRVVLPKGKTAAMDVTFVAIKKEIAENYLSILQEAGLKVDVMEPAPFSLVRLFAMGNQLAKDKPTAIVDIDYGMANINIVKNRICYLTRDITLPSEKEVVFDNLLNEIRMTLEYYEKLFPADVVAKLLLCGEVQLKDWDRALQEEVKMPVEQAITGKTVRAGRVPLPLNMPVVIGLALRGSTTTVTDVDFFKKRPVKAKPAAKKSLALKLIIRQAIWRAILVSAVGLLALYFFMLPNVDEQKRQLAKELSLRPQIDLPIASFSYSRLQELEKELRDKLSSLQTIMDQRVFWTKKLDQLPKELPQGTWLTHLFVSEKLNQSNKISRSLIIKGVAYHQDSVQEIGLVTKLVSQLQQNKEFAQGFTEIKLDTMNSATLKEMPVKEFTITCSK